MNCWRIVAPVLSLTLLTLLPGCHKQQSTVSTVASDDKASPWTLALRVTPAHPSMAKPMTFLLHIGDDHGQPLNDVQVNGTLTMKTMDMGATKLQFTPKGNGDYEASVKGMDMSGPWNLAIDATRAGTHVRTNFEVTVFD